MSDVATQLGTIRATVTFAQGETDELPQLPGLDPMVVLTLGIEDIRQGVLVWTRTFGETIRLLLEVDPGQLDAGGQRSFIRAIGTAERGLVRRLHAQAGLQF